MTPPSRGRAPVKGKPDLAGAVVFLASEAADNINGCTFQVYHGRVGIYQEPVVYQMLVKDGSWTPEELVDSIPKTICKGRSRELPPGF